MKTQTRLWKVLCWTAAILVFNACFETCLSIEPKVLDEREPAQSESLRSIIPQEIALNDTAQADTTLAQENDKPIYKRWWALGVAGGILLTSVIILVSGGDDKGKEDLPDFPDPPERQ